MSNKNKKGKDPNNESRIVHQLYYSPQKYINRQTYQKIIMLNVEI